MHLYNLRSLFFIFLTIFDIDVYLLCLKPQTAEMTLWVHVRVSGFYFLFFFQNENMIKKTCYCWAYIWWNRLWKKRLLISFFFLRNVCLETFPISAILLDYLKKKKIFFLIEHICLIYINLHVIYTLTLNVPLFF